MLLENEIPFSREKARLGPDAVRPIILPHFSPVRNTDNKIFERKKTTFQRHRKTSHRFFLESVFKGISRQFRIAQKLSSRR